MSPNTTNITAIQSAVGHAAEEDTGNVTLTRNGRQLYIDPPCAAVLDDLITICHVAVDDPYHGYRLEKQAISLVSCAKNEPNVGIMAAAAVRLHAAGYRVHFRCRRTVYGLPHPDTSLIPGRRCDRTMLSLLQEWPEGIIRYRAGHVEVAWLIWQIYVAYPDATIAIVEESSERRQQLVSQLRKIGVQIANVDANRCPRQECRVVASSWIGLTHGEIEAEKRDILLVADVRQTVSHRGQLAWSMVEARFRLFGLLTEACQLSPLQRDLIAATFGFVDVHIPAHGHTVRPVRVVWWPFRGGEAIPFVADDLCVKKKGVWYNHCHNRHIAKLAQAIRENDAKWLEAEVPQAASAIDSMGTRRTAILVEGVDHALALATMLPHWPIVTAPEVCCAGMDRRQRRLLADRRAAWWDGE